MTTETDRARRVGIIGLGIMGTAYARNLIGSGFDVYGTDIDESRRQSLADLGGEPLRSPREVATNVDMVLVALPSVTALQEVTADLANAGREGLVVVEMSTFPLDAKLAALAVLRTSGAEMIDAPVSGTGLQADAAEIVVYASGGSAIIEKLQPVFQVIARETFDLGEFGNGSKMKFVANLLVSIHNLATAEAFVLGKKAGLEPQQLLDVISAGVGSSRIFEIRGPMMVAGEFPAAAKLAMFIKDIDIIGQFGREIGVPTPLLDAALPWYREAVEKGLGDLDAAALERLLGEKAGLDG